MDTSPRTCANSRVGSFEAIIQRDHKVPLPYSYRAYGFFYQSSAFYLLFWRGLYAVHQTGGPENGHGEYHGEVWFEGDREDPYGNACRVFEGALVGLTSFILQQKK